MLRTESDFVTDLTRWAFPACVAADAGRGRVRPQVGARQRRRASRRNSRRRVHRVDPRHRSHRQRRRDSRRRPRPHDRLPHHRGRVGLAHARTTARWSKATRSPTISPPASASCCRSAGSTSPMIERGSATSVAEDDDVYVVGHGGRAHALKATVFAKREFAGFWEYLLDTALFTTPPHPEWSGAALLDEQGRLIGIGSLLLQEKVGDDVVDGNMFVPVDLHRADTGRSRADRAVGGAAAAVARHVHGGSRRPPRGQRACERRSGRARRRARGRSRRRRRCGARREPRRPLSRDLAAWAPRAPRFR